VGEIVTQGETDVPAGRKISDSMHTASYLKKLESPPANRRRNISKAGSGRNVFLGHNNNR